jgi:hypothetical protein
MSLLCFLAMLARAALHSSADNPFFRRSSLIKTCICFSRLEICIRGLPFISDGRSALCGGDATHEHKRSSMSPQRQVFSTTRDNFFLFIKQTRISLPIHHIAEACLIGVRSTIILIRVCCQLILYSRVSNAGKKYGPASF